MATLNYNTKGQNSITVFAQLDSGVGAGTKVMKWYYKKSSDPYWIPDGSTTGTNGTQNYYHTFSGLSPSTTYDLNCDFYTETTFNTSLYVNGITTDSPPLPSALTGLTKTNGNGTASLSWNSSSNAVSYDVFWSPANSTGSTSANTSSTSYTIQNLANGTTYSVTVYPKNSSGQYGTPGTISVTPVAPAPIGTPSITVSTYENKYIGVSWSGVSQVNNYKVYVNNLSGSGDVLKYDGSDTSATFYVDAEYHTYYVKVVPYNSGTQGSVNTKNFTSLDETDPVSDSFYVGGLHVRSIDVIATGHDVTPSGNSLNGQSGVQGYWFYISYNGGATWTFCKQINTSGTGYYTYADGVDGVSMAPNVTYTFGVRTIDNANNSSEMITCTGKTKYDRPPNWGWTTGKDFNNHKIVNGNYSMLASEWNSFTSKINDFLLYKEVISSPVVFTTAWTGNEFAAAMFNETAGQINRMITVSYTTKSRGNSVQADDLNYLMDRLNSIS